jgi:hypothetical protein
MILMDVELEREIVSGVCTSGLGVEGRMMASAIG